MTETVNQTLNASNWTRVESILRRGIKTGVFLILLTPMVILAASTFPALLPKAYYFRIIVEIIFLLFIFLVLLNRAYLPRITPLFLAVFVFIEVIMFSTFRGINPMRSFWGTLERGEGFILMIHLFLFFIVLVSVLRTKEEWMNVFRFLVVSSIPLGILGLLEKFTTYAIYTDPSASRVSATFGNPLFYAAYLIFIIFLAVFLAFHDYAGRQPSDRSKKKNIKSASEKSIAPFTIPYVTNWIFYFLRKKGWIVFGFLAAFNFFIFLLTGSRGAWIGVAAGVGFLILTWLLAGARQKKQEFQRKAVLFGTFLVFLFFLLFLLFSKVGYIPETNFVERYDNLWFKVAEGNFGRVLVWQLGIEAWKDAPLFGHGPDSFSYIFDKYYHAGLLKNFPVTLFFDRAHNKIVDVLVFTGIIGLISYVAVFATAGYQMLRYYNERFNLFVSLLFIALLIAYILQNIVTFDTVTSYIMFFLILAFIDVNFRKKQASESELVAEKDHGFSSNSENTKQSVSSVRNKAAKVGIWNPWVRGSVALAAFALVVFIIWWANISPFITNAQLARSHRNFGAGELTKAFEGVEKILSGPEFMRNEMAYYATETMFFAQRLPEYRDSQTAKMFSERLQQSARSLETSLARRPEVLEMRGYLLLARAYMSIYFIENDLKHLDGAEHAVGSAIRLNPQFPEPYRLAGKIKFFQGKKDDGIVFFAKAYELDKDLKKFHEWLGESLADAGELSRGAETLRRSLRIGEFYTNENFNLQKVWNLAELYERADNYPALAIFYEEVISYSPGQPHPQLFASLSQVYGIIGDKEKARATTERMLELYPGLQSQAEEFLKTLE